jgi:type II secretory pathway pseudopilin PulG
MVRTLPQARSARPAFTLVEMMVASALILFIMYILATAFQAGLLAIGQLKSVSGLQEQLRYASSAMRRDLSAPHFANDTDAYHGPALSQQRLDLYDWSPPKEGFFRIWQGSASNAAPNSSVNAPANVLEGIDADGIPSYRVTNNYLHFTVRLPATGRDQVFATQALPTSYYTLVSPDYLRGNATTPYPEGVFYSPWAEVAYFLQANGQSAGGTPLYTLYRRQKLLVDSRPPNTMTAMSVASPSFSPGSQFVDMSTYHPSANGTQMMLNIPADVTAPLRRFGMLPNDDTAGIVSTSVAGVWNNQATSPASTFPLIIQDKDPNTVLQSAGDDALLNNVLSFEIKVAWDSPNSPTNTSNDTRFPSVASPSGLDAPFDDLPTPPSTTVNGTSYGGNAFFNGQGLRVFDTWSQAKDTASPQRYDFADPLSIPNPPPAQQLPPAWSHAYMTDQIVLGGGTLQKPQNTTIPLRVRVRALQIRIRVWDLKTQQARQITIVQDV